MYRRALQLTARGLRILPHKSRSRFAVTAPYRLSLPHLQLSLPAQASQFRGFVTSRKLYNAAISEKEAIEAESVEAAEPETASESELEQAEDVATPEPGTPEYVVFMAKELSKKDKDKPLKVDEVRKYLEQIKEGPLAVAKMFEGQIAGHNLYKIVGLAEMYVRYSYRCTSEEDYKEFDPFYFKLRNGPRGLCQIAMMQRRKVDGELLDRIAEAEALIRTKEGCEKLESEDQEMDQSTDNDLNRITHGLLQLVLRKEKWVGPPRPAGEYLPGGPFEILLGHLGEPITDDIVKEVEDAEPRLADGSLSPVGPMRTVLYKWQYFLGMRKDKDVVSAEEQRQIFPYKINERLLTVIAEAEEVLKRHKGDTSTGPIPNGPVEFLRSNMHMPLSKIRLNTIKTLQAEYLGGNRKDVELIFIPGTPAYLLEHRKYQRDKVPSSVEKDDRQATQLESIADLADIHGIELGGLEEQKSPEVGKLKIPSDLPPMEVINAYVVNLFKRWEDAYRLSMAVTLAGDEERSRRSPTAVAKRLMGRNIDREVYDAIMGEELALLGQVDAHNLMHNGPSKILRRIVRLEESQWVKDLEKDAFNKSKEYLRRMVEHLSTSRLPSLERKDEGLATQLKSMAQRGAKLRSRLEKQTKGKIEIDVLLALPLEEAEKTLPWVTPQISQALANYKQNEDHTMYLKKKKETREKKIEDLRKLLARLERKIMVKFEDIAKLSDEARAMAMKEAEEVTPFEDKSKSLSESTRDSAANSVEEGPSMILARQR